MYYKCFFKLLSTNAFFPFYFDNKEAPIQIDFFKGYTFILKSIEETVEELPDGVIYIKKKKAYNIKDGSREPIYDIEKFIEL